MAQCVAVNNGNNAASNQSGCRGGVTMHLAAYRRSSAAANQ